MEDLGQMNCRLEVLSSLDITMEESDQNSASRSTTPTSDPVAQTVDWTLLYAQSSWKPCPIGVCYHRREVCEDVPVRSY